MLSAEEKIQLAAQIALSKRLGLGLALSLLPVAGLGSATAIWIGVSARKQIAASGGKLVGAGAAAWCMAAGVVGLIGNVFLLWPMFFRVR